MKHKFAPALLISVLTLLGLFYSTPVQRAGSVRTESASSLAMQKFRKQVDFPALSARLPLSFEQNLGQFDARAKFSSRGPGYDLFLTGSGAILELSGAPKRNPRSSNNSDIVLKLALAGASPDTKVQGVDELPGRRNYFIGNDPSRWHTNIPTYRAVRYSEVYPGIDLTYYGNQQQLEYDFSVAPGSDPGLIRLSFNSVTRPQITDSGDLVLRTALGEIRQHRPVTYQEIDGQRRQIESRFVLLNSRHVGFAVSPYDKTKPLVIDPTLVFSTYLGSSGDDPGSSIAVDSNGNIYLAGTTNSTTFPLQNPAYGSNAGLSDIFVTKIDPAGASIIYSTYVGGSGIDRGDGIAIDSNGNAYVVGRIDSTSTNFPSTVGSFAATYRGGDFDGVVFKLNAQGNALVYSGFLGGEENDSVEGVTVDSAGVAYVTGGTKSNSFPTTLTAYQGNRAGDTDAFLTKINSSGSGLLYSSFIGGAGTDRGSGVVIDGAGVAYLAGYGASPDFPTADPFQAGFGGSFDAFVAKFDTNASGVNSLLFCSYLGGAGDDKSFGIAIDSSASNVYVVGQTSSNDFPVLNPAQPATGGSFDAFIAKISAGGAKVYATYLGGSGDDRGTGIAVNSSGVYVTGFTSSTNLPTVAPLQISNGGGFDAFVAKLNPAGSVFLYTTYFGGSANENFVAAVTSTGPIAVDASNAYITGYTASTNFPTGSPLQGTKSGGQDAFVAKIADATPAADFSLTIAPGSRTVSPGGGTTFSVTATPAGGFTGTIGLSVSGLSNDSSSTFNPLSIVINDASAKSSTLTINTAQATAPGTYNLTVTAISGNLQHSIPAQLIVSGAASANLALTKTASPNPAVRLANLTYRITVTNNGPSPATNVTITDNLPSGINFVSATPTQGSCSGQPTVTCNLGSLGNGASAIVNIVATPQSAGQLSNTAGVTATESDPDTSDNSVTIQTIVNTPSGGPTMLDPNLSVKTVVTGLSQPTSMAFIGNNDFLVFEKNTGKIQRVINGVIQNPPPLDLAVNSGSERGGLGLALHPNFTFNGYVYLYWTESSTGVDSTNLSEVATLGNRVDRYIWNGSTLTFDRNVIKLRAFQADANQSLRGNHNGGILRFGPDGKLYILMGDNGRRGYLQNNQLGPVPDDQFGGPEPDNNHLTGFVLRLNDDGSTPSDNPFFNVPTTLTGEAATNVKKLFAYGVRNGFGMSFDPYSGSLWDQENGDDAFDEMNRITPGSNNGWVQMMGPNSRVAQFKQIESTYGAGDLQQLRWPTSLISSTPAAALAALYMLPGAHYNDPEFSWKYAVAPATMGFAQGRGLGPQFEGDMFVGASRTFLANGFLFRFKLTNDRLHFLFTDSRLNDLVADNNDKFDINESETLLIGSDFGITTDIETGPNGDLYVVSNSNGAVYQISGKQPSVFTANLTPAQETPPTNSSGTGTATLLLSPDEKEARLSLNFSDLTSAETGAHIHGPGAAGVVAPIIFPLANGNLSDVVISLTPEDVANLKSGLLYINVHTSSFPNGEIRGQFGTSASASSVEFTAATYLFSESAGRATITVNRLGDSNGPASVDYSTADNAATNNCAAVSGDASAKCDYASVLGTLHFAPGETSKTINVPITDDAYSEGNEILTISLSNASGVFLGSPNIATITINDNENAPGVNPIDASDFFVHQHYIDFLNREPDPSGFAFWVSNITSCGSDQQCVEVKRINVSAAFFLSIEFQQTGYFVERVYRAAFGTGTGASTLGAPHQFSVPIIRLSEFLPDTQRIGQGVIVGQGNWQQQLDDNKNDFTNEFVQRVRFTTSFPSNMGAAPFVDMLNANAGSPLTQAERNQLVNDLQSGAKTRAQVLRVVAENANFVNSEFNRAFVLMQYFGYLRRNPNDLPDTDYTGYDFWLTKLNQFNGNYQNAEMVKAFISSTEYRQRFGP
jgi:aldose sugar dehydrogenase